MKVIPINRDKLFKQLIIILKSFRMKTLNYFLFIMSIIFISCSSPDQEDFVSLFNGKDLTNWKLQKPGGFEVVDGEMITRSFGSGNDIYSERSYSNFILRLEFMLSEVGNSGIFIRQNPSEPGTGFEVQLLAPWTPWRDDLHCTGSLYGHVAVTDRPDETTGRWYKMEIKCDRNIVTVAVEDKITTSADIDTVKTMAGKPYTGYIGFQGNHAEKEGQYAKFRNIFIHDFDLEPGYVLKGFSNENELLRRQSLNAAVNLGAIVVQPLADLMSGDDPMEKSLAKQALFDIVAKASDPEASAKEKKEVKSALRKSIKKTSSEITTVYLKWISGMISR
jgi:hypothetical protein